MKKNKVRSKESFIWMPNCLPPSPQPIKKNQIGWLLIKRVKYFFFFLTALRHLCHMQKMKKKNHDFMKTAATVAGGCVSCVPSLHQSLPQVPAQPLRERTKKKVLSRAVFKNGQNSSSGTISTNNGLGLKQ